MLRSTRPLQARHDGVRDGDGLHRGHGHVWKTTNAGTTWTDFAGIFPTPQSTRCSFIPESLISECPPRCTLQRICSLGSPTSAPSWTELGPNPSTGLFGFLPNVAVTALAVFNSGDKQLVRASTYGRGIWEFNLVIVPDFLISVSKPQATIFPGQTRHSAAPRPR